MPMKQLSKIGVLVTTIPLTLLLIVIILCSTIENVHSTLLDIGESQWTGYSELRQPAVKPDCDPDAKPEPAPQADDDDLLDDLFGEEEEISDDAQAAAREICLAKIEKYENLVKRQEDSGLQAFISVEGAVGHIATSSVGFVKEFLILIFIFCGLAVTLQRQHLGLRSPRTVIADRVSQLAQLTGNLIVVLSFLAYYRQDIASGVDNVSKLPIYWMIGFGLMALANLLLLLRPIRPEANVPKASLGEIMLGIPLYAYMAWICGLYFGVVEQHFAGVAIYLNQMTEHANLYSNVALYVFSGMMLKYTNIADKFFAIIRPLKLSPELLAFFIVLLSAVPTAYSGASGIFVIAAGAIIYRELKRSRARDSLALAATAMSGSMGIVLSPCLLVVIIAALNKDVTTTELFHAGFNVFLVNIFVFLIVIFATKHERFRWSLTLFDWAKNAKIFGKIGKAVVPVLPYIGIGAVVLMLFRFGLGAKFDEYSAAWLLPFVLIMLLIFDRIMAKRAYLKAKASPEGAQLSGDADDDDAADVETQTNIVPANPEDQEESEETEAATESLKETETVAETETQKEAPKAQTAPDGILKSLFNAANSTAVASGGLLALMTLSICVGGIIDRANLNELLPQTFTGDFHAVMAMGMLFVILVFIGMIMDPYGAVILVSATLTQIASANGINPVHFWVTVLCAFELGYLTPPVALNQLLTRQVVGENAFEYERAKDQPTSFWQRHERILLPVTIKGIVLLLVAFGPLLINILRWKLK